MHYRHSARRFGILFRSRKIWISELLSITMVIIIAGSLFLLSRKIISNELALYRNNERITSYQANRVVMTHYLKELNNRVAIAELLCSIAGNSLKPGILFDLSEIVYQSSNEFGYDPLLLLAVIEVESVFNPEAYGRFRNGEKSGALGLMQIKPETAQEIADRLGMDTISPDDLFKPEINVILGVAYLTTMIERFKNFKLGILAYNQGPGTISKQLSEKSPLSVRYYQKVLVSYFRLKKHARHVAAVDRKASVCR
jgi:soluble lytic murein transglycosylase-like protein